jgi:hypothetical protein
MRTISLIFDEVLGFVEPTSDLPGKYRKTRFYGIRDGSLGRWLLRSMADLVGRRLVSGIVECLREKRGNLIPC